MNATYIEWVKNPDGTQGYTWNAITGCLNHDNGLCKGGGFPCYAYKLAHGRLKPLYLANKNIADYDIYAKPVGERIDNFADPFYPRLWEDRVYQHCTIPNRDYEPKNRGILVCDMSDLFGIGIPEEWTRKVLESIKLSPHHRFYLLTKQPQNLIKFNAFPDNCWVGVTVCNDKMLDVAVDKLEDVQARVKYISFEPLLERLTFSLDYAFCYSGISWVIIGACTGSASDIGKLIRRYPDLVHKPLGNKWTAQPPIEWLREIVEAADKAGVKVFLKNNLEPLFLNERKLYWEGFYGEHALRQELPGG